MKSLGYNCTFFKEMFFPIILEIYDDIHIYDNLANNINQEGIQSVH